MDISFPFKDKVCLVASYKNGQTNVYDNFIPVDKSGNEKELVKILNQINKKQNYFPKKMEVVKAIMFIETE